MAMSFHVNALIPNSGDKPSSIGGHGATAASVSDSMAESMSGKDALLARSSEQVCEMPVSANESIPSKKKVIVVGAGISGLRAAAMLQQHGVEVTVLEARDRIGGRIHTTHEDGFPKDIGAAWMHETSQNNLVNLISKLKIPYYYDDGLPLYYTEHGRTGSQFKAKKVADEFADYLEWYYETHPNAPDRSVNDFCKDFINTHLLISDDEREWAPQAVREVQLWIGTSIEEASAKHLSYFITERNLYMKGGYDRIVQWTAEPLMKSPDTIRLNHAVQSVDWNDQGDNVSVHCVDADGQSQTITGDSVIMTIPLGAYKHNLVDFNPPLPEEIELGHSRFSYGALGKVFFEFEDVFFSKENDQFIYIPSPETITPFNPDSILSYASVTINLWIMAGHNVLCTQIAEPLTQRVERMNKEEVYAFFEPLLKLFRTEPHKKLPKLRNVETTHWTQDKYAGFGSYSADKVGDDADILMDALEKHKRSRLQFAGEHTTMVANGCVHGAFASGENAARNILSNFQHECGPDCNDCQGQLVKSQSRSPSP